MLHSSDELQSQSPCSLRLPLDVADEYILQFHPFGEEFLLQNEESVKTNSDGPEEVFPGVYCIETDVSLPGGPIRKLEERRRTSVYRCVPILRVLHRGDISHLGRYFDRDGLGTGPLKHWVVCIFQLNVWVGERQKRSESVYSWLRQTYLTEFVIV